MEEKYTCTHCGAVIDDDEYELLDGEPICRECVDNYTCACTRCDRLIYDSDSFGDEYHNLCQHCYDNHYTHCHSCDALICNEDAYEFECEDYCSECYDDVRYENSSIKEYSYKPEPLFYGADNLYLGIELEIDDGGKDSEYADDILYIGNKSGEHIYIKSDGSLDDGFEIVSHPMTMEYHKKYQWEDIFKKAVNLGYRSHQTSTCGLHIHVNRNAFGDNQMEQEEVISKILYFIEKHWNEVFQFSRRSTYNMNRWSARYGFEKTGKAILDKAKNGSNGRYVAVNLSNYHTIEFRLFRGTLKYNTFIATLQMVSKICDVALSMSECDIDSMSWSSFVSTIEDEELIQYLKERRLYVNDEITNEEEM